jgi:hypothetical protein
MAIGRVADRAFGTFMLGSKRQLKQAVAAFEQTKPILVGMEPVLRAEEKLRCRAKGLLYKGFR